MAVAAQPACPSAVSIVAQQKTGSTFLSRFTKDIALRHQMCKVVQTTKEFICQTSVSIDCPRRVSLRNKSVWLEKTFGPAAAAGSRGSASLRERCNDLERHRMYAAASEWLETPGAVHRHNISVRALLSSNGFVRGPMRQLCALSSSCVGTTGCNVGPSTSCVWTEMAAYHAVIIVHTRHPIEMMVSAFFCIVDAKVCPVRNKLLGKQFVPKNDTVESLDAFVLSGVRTAGSTPSAILGRSESMKHFISGFSSNARSLPASRCPAPTLVHSKYERMVSDFASWAQELLQAITGLPASQMKSLSAPMCALCSLSRAPRRAAEAPSDAAMLRREAVGALGRTCCQSPSRLAPQRCACVLGEAGALRVTLPPPPARAGGRVRRYENEFVPDGKHKHSLRVGSNMAKLQPATLDALRDSPRLQRLLRDLGYLWHQPYLA